LAASTGCGSAKKEAAGDEAAKPTASVDIVDVVTKPIRKLVTLNGSFLPGQGSSARLTAAAPGRIDKVLVKEGDSVRQGQLLATLDVRVQKSQEASAAAALRAAQAQAQQSQLNYQAAASDQDASVRNATIALDQARIQRESDVTQAELAFDVAKADLAKTRAGARPQEIAQAHEATIQAQAARDRAASELRRTQDLAPSGYVSRRQLEDAQTALTTAGSALAAAQANESLVRAGARPEELKSAEDRAAAARHALESTRLLSDRKVAAAETALKQTKADAATVRAKLHDVLASQATASQRASDVAAAAATTELSEIRAPFDGRISRRFVGRGDPADTTTPIFEIVRSGGSTDFVAGALPTDAAQIRPGMLADLTFQSGEAKGQVVAVSSADPQTGLDTVRISCSETPPVGTYGTASIVVETMEHVTAVPDAAVLNRDGKTMVLKDVDGIAKETEIEAGPSDHGFTAVQSGLKPGEKVVSLGGYELDDGAKIKPAEPKADAAAGGDKS
jgi:HlyD family secretion protein